MHLTAHQVADIQVQAEDLCDDEVGIYAHYSGRGMYGATCLGFTVRDMAGMLALSAAIVSVLTESSQQAEIPGMMRGAAKDSMGYDTIVYFPGVHTDYVDQP